MAPNKSQVIRLSTRKNVEYMIEIIDMRDGWYKLLVTSGNAYFYKYVSGDVLRDFFIGTSLLVHKE